MQFSDGLEKSVSSKLLPFRAPSTEGRAAPVTLDPDQVPHDIARLPRPVVATAPRLPEQDGLAHDARNLMTSLELLSSLLAEPGVLGERHGHYAEDLRLLNRSLGSLVERMAAVHTARNEQPVFVLEPLHPAPTLVRAQSQEWNDAGAMVKSSERLLSAIAGPATTLHVSADRGVGRLKLGGEELTRVLINLVKNASEAMPGGGRVAVTLRKGRGADPCAILTVEDTGPGIPAHAMGQIFQAGFSSKREQRRWPATRHYGLGLAIVRELVEGAGGSVRVSSAVKKGTTFEIRLPRHNA